VRPTTTFVRDRMMTAGPWPRLGGWAALPILSGLGFRRMAALHERLSDRSIATCGTTRASRSPWWIRATRTATWRCAAWWWRLRMTQTAPLWMAWRKYLGVDRHPWHQEGDEHVTIVILPQHTSQMGGSMAGMRKRAPKECNMRAIRVDVPGGPAYPLCSMPRASVIAPTTGSAT
jgi:hypothetical protein